MADRVCSVDDCGSTASARGWCNKHYQAWRRYGDPRVNRKRSLADAGPSSPTCTVAECRKPLYGKGLCNMHWQRLRKAGSTDDPIVREGRSASPCSVPDCQRGPTSRGLCLMHWKRQDRHGTLNPRFRGQIVDGKRICPGCERDLPLSQWRVIQGRYDRCLECFAELNRHRAAVRRALSANPLGVVEAFTRLDVMVRDGWVCQLCAEPIDPDLKHPHPQSASLDHVIPLARGGHHMLTNCQAAHLRCNLKKWAHMPGQEASRG